MGYEITRTVGVSWESFRRNNKQQEITDDLVLGGIPIVAARDIVALASKQMERSTAPMAIFWDLGNVSIPVGIRGHDIVQEIKTKLAPHGHLVQFRAYASTGLHLIPPNTRSDLQLAGCHIVDCPHGSRKDVVDKMIIVDAMHFAYLLPDNATICFITGDMDYAYLFAVLQHNKNWRTIMISNETASSNLRVNCDVRMIWEKDIVQPIAGSSVQKQIDPHQSSVAANELPKTINSSPKNAAAKDSTSKNEDRELIHSAMLRLSNKSGKSTFFKSDVATKIKEMNPLRFANRKDLKAFLKKAIASGVVHEEGEGPNKMLTLLGLSADLDISSEIIWPSLRPKTAALSTSLERSSVKNTGTSQPSKSLSDFNPHVDSNGNSACPGLYVCGFGPGTTKQQVYDLFAEYTKVVKITDMNLHGYRIMFVRTNSTNAAISARQQLQGMKLNNGILRINFSRLKA